MKRPYLCESRLLPRVTEFLEKRPDADFEETMENIMMYPEYRLKSKKAFKFSVRKAYDYVQYQNKAAESDNDSIIIDDDDGGGPDIIDMDEELPESMSMNNVLNAMYKKATPSTPKNTHSGNNSSSNDKTPTNGVEQNHKKKKRKRESTAPNEITQNRKVKKEAITVQTSNLVVDDLLVLSSDLITASCMSMLSLKLPEKRNNLKSILVTGCTGSGKTTFIKSIVGSAKANLLSVTSSDLMGDSDVNIKDVIDQAVQLAPCVIHIDEIDKAATKEMPKSQERKFIAQFSSSLKEIMDSHSEAAVIVLAECSKPEALDDNLRHLFSHEVFMPIPNEKERFNILKKIGNNSNFSENDWREIANKTLSYTIGDIVSLIKKANYLKTKRIIEDLNVKSPSNSLMNIIDRYLELNKKSEEEISVTLHDFREAIKNYMPALKKEMFPTIPEVSMHDVGSLENIKKDLEQLIIKPIELKDVYEKFNARRPSGILLWGPPGCGKTLLAKAIANMACLNLLPVSGPEILNMYQGESEKAIRSIFLKAKSVAPCVIFFDEFDGICPARNNKSESGSKTTVVNTLLAEMNGISSRKDVYVIATTNRPDMLDSAITRPGRFDTTIFVGLPDLKGRESILLALTKNRTMPKLSPCVDLAEIAKRCSYFSGADLSWLIFLASSEAIDQLDKNDPNPDCTVNMSHFEKAMQKVHPSTTEKQIKHYERLKDKFKRSKDFVAISEGDDNQSARE